MIITITKLVTLLLFFSGNNTVINSLQDMSIRNSVKGSSPMNTVLNNSPSLLQVDVECNVQSLPVCVRES